MALSRAPSSRMTPQTLTTARKVFVNNGGGSHSWSTTEILTAVPASIQSGNTPEALTAGAMREVKTWDVYIGGGLDAQAGDTFDNPEGTGGTVEILSVRDMAGRLTEQHLVCAMQMGVNVK